MFLINIGGFLFLCLILSWYYKETLATVLPCGTGVLICLLYILAFFQKLSSINIINLCFILLAIILIIKRKDAFNYIKNEIFSASAVIIFVTYFTIFLCVKDKMITHWDELGVWGLEVKSIYFMNGFADKYKFTAIGYADYFPGQMLFEWWTCHFSPYVFKEGLAYVGYYWLYATFLMPLLKYTGPKKKHYAVPLGIVWVVFIMLLPGVTGTFGYRFLSAELLISAVFAYCLFQYIDIHKHNTSFSIINLMLCTIQLMMFKETGILYAILSLLFGCIILTGKKERGFYRNVDMMGYTGVIIISFISSIPVIIWKIYCKILERGKYFDNATKHLVASLSEHNYQVDENAGLYITAFLEALFKEPLHEDKTVFMDMTVAFCVLLILCLVVYIYKEGRLTGKECRKICLFYIVSFILSSIALIGMHIFIFREDQYIETSTMIKSISRYLEPMFFGILIFLFYLLISGNTTPMSKRKNIILCMGVILLCTNYKMAYDSIINYKSRIEVVNADREIILQNYADLFKDLQRSDTVYCNRILCLEPVNNLGYERLLRYLVAPNSLILQQVASDKNVDAFKEDIKYDVTNNHCEYIFFYNIETEYLNAAFGENAGCLTNTLMHVNVNENDDIVFSYVK